jgi:hypothetical protein
VFLQATIIHNATAKQYLQITSLLKIDILAMPCLSGRRRRRWRFVMSRRNSRRSRGFKPFGGISRPMLDGFLKSDVNFLQLPRLLSQFRSIDHEKNISSCIAQVAALRGTFENRLMSGGNLDLRTLILIWDTGASFELTPVRSDFIDYVECDILMRDGTKLYKVIGIGTTYMNSPIQM